MGPDRGAADSRERRSPRTAPWRPDMPISRALPPMLAHLVRGGRTFLALRRLRRVDWEGGAVAQNPALDRLAAAMGVPREIAHDVVLGRMNPQNSARDHVAVAQALRGAAHFALLSPATARNLADLRAQARNASDAAARHLGRARTDLRLAAHNVGTMALYHARRGDLPATQTLLERRSGDRERLTRLTEDLQLLRRDHNRDE